MPAPWKGRRTRHFAGYDVALVSSTLSLQGDTSAFPVCSPEVIPGPGTRLPRPLELFDRQRERRGRVRHAAELDHEVGRRRGVDGFENHDRVGLAEQSEELVDHDVVRDLRVLEQAGRVLPLTGEDLELRHKEHRVTGGASGADDLKPCGGAIPRRRTAPG